MSQPSCTTWNSVEQKLQHKGPGPGSRLGKGEWPESEKGLWKKGSEVILRETGSLVKVGTGQFYIRLWSIRILSMEALLFSSSSLRCM